MKNKFPRLFVEAQELVRQHKLLGAGSVSDKFKGSSAQMLLIKTKD